MAADESVSQRPRPSEKSSSKDESSGFARIARRIARRSTDLLAIAIVAVGGLTVAGRLSQWWSTDAEELTSPSRLAGSLAGSTSPWGRGGLPVSFDLGDRLGTLRKQFVVGDRERATAALLDICRELVTAADVPPDPRDFENPGDLGSTTEQRLLAELEKRDPTEEQKKTWRIYAVDETLPLVLGTRKFPAESAGDGRKNGAVGRPRVVCWGMAFPSGKDRWTLFAFHSPGRGSSPRPGDVALPPGSRRIMSLRAETGEALIGFEGGGPPEEWGRFFDRWFRENGWRLSGRWKSSADGWSARYVPAGGDRGSRVDVHFARIGDSTWNGLLDVVPIVTNRK